MLRSYGARGCVVMGGPRCYERFGFRQDARLRYSGVPEELPIIRVSRRPETVPGAVENCEVCSPAWSNTIRHHPPPSALRLADFGGVFR